MPDFKLYYIEFWDHFCGERDIVKCSFVGWLVSEDKKRLHMTPWISHCKEEDQAANFEDYAIIKSCVLKKKLLKL